MKIQPDKDPAPELTEEGSPPLRSRSQAKKAPAVAKPGKAKKAPADPKPRKAKKSAGELNAGKKKKRRPLTTVMLVAFAIAAIAITVMMSNRGGQNTTGAAKEDKKKTASEKVIQVGETVRKGTFEASVLGLNKDFRPANPLEAPEEGKKLIAVEFKLTNRDSDPVLVSSSRQFHVKDTDGTRYDVSPTGVPDPRFPEGRLAPGQTVQGWLAFKVPRSSTKLNLVFDARVVPLPAG